MQRILQEIMKKIIHGTSDTWLMSRSSQRPSDPAYYIEDCRICEVTHGDSTDNRIKSSFPNIPSKTFLMESFHNTLFFSGTLNTNKWCQVSYSLFPKQKTVNDIIK